tara:strand:+ start:59 stop:580 length:522 start_codon:yes stop_codon:yes gene_type:complete
MKIKFLPIIITFLFLIFFIIFLKGLKNSNIYTPNLIQETKIPSFTSQLFDSTKEINSNKIFVGNKFYLLNIWSSWCVPCRYEHEFLVRLSKEKNLKIVGLNYKDNIENAKNYLEELSNPYDILISDQSGLTAIEWGAYGVPETFLIYEKKILKKIIGPITNDLMNEIKKIIKL